MIHLNAGHQGGHDVQAAKIAGSNALCTGGTTDHLWASPYHCCCCHRRVRVWQWQVIAHSSRCTGSPASLGVQANIGVIDTWSGVTMAR